MQMLSKCGANLDGKDGRTTATTGLTTNYIGNATNKISNFGLPCFIRVKGCIQLRPGTFLGLEEATKSPNYNSIELEAIISDGCAESEAWLLLNKSLEKMCLCQSN